MIPERFKKMVNLNIEVFGHTVQVSYNFYWPEQKEPAWADLLVSPIEYCSD